MQSQGLAQRIALLQSTLNVMFVAMTIMLDISHIRFPKIATFSRLQAFMTSPFMFIKVLFIIPLSSLQVYQNYCIILVTRYQGPLAFICQSLFRPKHDFWIILLFIVEIFSKKYQTNFKTNNRQLFHTKKFKVNPDHSFTNNNHIAFQDLFAKAALKVLGENSVQSNKELCYKINYHLKLHRYTSLWVDISQMIPHKTHIQLRDYYSKSFSKFMFQEFISFQDKLALKSMYQQTPTEKPSKIVERFIESTGNTQYSKRNLVMYQVNMKNKNK
ncbi:Hypothetical_protein [Hexamita inflata]|uniref:Hypothetical_protein n=1 Tax=Hexamita inflata TaxID=28002 RepID=A0AA86UUB2_9EUKA|nr:Hypothetical protein HINF_LOCUS52787 [Hexamita inflata]